MLPQKKLEVVNDRNDLPSTEQVESAPLTAETASIFGCMKGTFLVTGDIVGPEPDVWEAMQD